jgi:hypothetical protein
MSGYCTVKVHNMTPFILFVRVGNYVRADTNRVTPSGGIKVLDNPK